MPSDNVLTFDRPAIDAVHATSVRASLEFALECLARSSSRNEPLEAAIEAALRLASRKELEMAVYRDLSKVRQRLGLYERIAGLQLVTDQEADPLQTRKDLF
ncbi:hypothetical protein [Henriciella aquimarina]|uniref:hypothetical protein n=1 Tax=Henriciella aquimarina TaxID=545261 RepID=UPI000A0094F3|nr:hypothetical protein [Henriciella aquimarina]